MNTMPCGQTWVVSVPLVRHNKGKTIKIQTKVCDGHVLQTKTYFTIRKDHEFIMTHLFNEWLAAPFF